MNKNLKNFLGLLFNFLILLSLDQIWFKISLNKFYLPVLNNINKNNNFKFRLLPGIFVWFIIAVYISIYQSLMYENLNYLSSLLFGLFSGFVIYSVYNFTNLATINNYTLSLSLIDTLWGTFLVGITSLLYFTLFH